MGGRSIITAAIGCLAILIVGIVALVFFVTLPFTITWRETTTTTAAPVAQTAPALVRDSEAVRAQVAVPTYTPGAPLGADSQAAAQAADPNLQLASTSNLLSERYRQISPGVVNISVFVSGAQGGQGAGSGFVLDTAGHIVTNNHVIEQAAQVTVVFFNGIEAPATIIGTDDDSDLAVIRVETLPEEVYPLPLADSSDVEVGDWAIAIGNPFGLGGSMTLGIVSAVGRVIPSGVSGFSIPQAIQTDAAINPGNSGGPLLDLSGEIIGVNAQIRTGGANANSGVGFAIPANVVRRVVPVLIEQGAYQWPWLGISGGPVNLLIAEANGLAAQRGAYIASVIPGGPAAEAGLQGSNQTTTIDSFTVPVGGDIVTAVDGVTITSFDALLTEVAFKAPNEEVTLTLVRDGETIEQTVQLAARPDLTDTEVQ